MPRPETAIARCRHGLFRYLPNDRYVGRSLELYGEFSEKESRLFDQLVRPGMLVVEVGANIGAHTVHLAQQVGKQGHVIAIEPQHVLHAILVDNLRHNGCDNAQAICCALGDRAGTVALPRIDYAAGTERNFGGVSLGQGEDLVPMLTLDSLQLNNLGLLKVDVEGMEVPVIRGALDTIRRCKPVLYVENDREDSSPALIELITGLGYDLWWHLPPLYNPDNFRGNRNNIFKDLISINMLGLPSGKGHKVALRPVTGPRDSWRRAPGRT